MTAGWTVRRHWLQANKTKCLQNLFYVLLHVLFYL